MLTVPPRGHQTREISFEPRTIAGQEAILNLTKDYLLSGAAPAHIISTGSGGLTGVHQLQRIITQRANPHSSPRTRSRITSTVFLESSARWGREALPETTPGAGSQETNSNSSMGRFLIHIDAQDCTGFFLETAGLQSGTSANPHTIIAGVSLSFSTSRPDYPVHPLASMLNGWSFSIDLPRRGGRGTGTRANGSFPKGTS